MNSQNSFLASRKGIILVGLFIGAVAAILQKLGNPANMGICVACMERDIAGALGLHRADVVQYIRPEIIGFVFGSFFAALLFKEFRARTGSAPIVRFVLGFFAMIGALVFLGCPWRALLRLAGGDGNAIVGLIGLAVGVGTGVFFFKNGFSLGASKKTYSSVGWIMPVFMFGLLLLLLLKPALPSGAVFFSSKGPGSQHAPIAASLLIAVTIGFLAQRTRFCTMGAIRDIILIKDFHLMSGVISLTLGVFIVNLIFNQFHPGFINQPISHTNILWNFGGMMLAGLAFALGGGCPGRQLFLSGEGDSDAAVFVFGMFAGAAFSHNFAAASSATVHGIWGPAAVVVGLIVCLIKRKNTISIQKNTGEFFMNKILDVRGLSCPQPVIEVQKKLSKAETGILEVYADKSAAKENISRMAQKNGWNVETIEQTDGFLLTLSKSQPDGIK